MLLRHLDFLWFESIQDLVLLIVSHVDFGKQARSDTLVCLVVGCLAGSLHRVVFLAAVLSIEDLVANEYIFVIMEQVLDSKFD